MSKVSRAPPGFPFVCSPGFKGQVKQFAEVADYFGEYFDEELIELIIEETNRYAT